jgi:hypothetical protein
MITEWEEPSEKIGSDHMKSSRCFQKEQYICHTVIHSKLQNVVYMKNKSMLKKKGGQHLSKKKGGGPHRVLSTRICGFGNDFQYIRRSAF